MSNTKKIGTYIGLRELVAGEGIEHSLAPDLLCIRTLGFLTRISGTYRKGVSC